MTKEANYDYEILSIIPKDDTFSLLVKIKEPEYVFCFENIKYQNDGYFQVDISVVRRSDTGELIRIDEPQLESVLKDLGEKLFQEVITKIIEDNLETA